MSRLISVQVVFSAGQRDMNAEHAMSEFLESFSKDMADEGAGVQFNKKKITRIVQKAIQDKKTLEEIISSHLTENWSIDRLDPVLLAILKCAASEVLLDPKTDMPIIINEYLNVGHAFFEKPQVVFLNGILEKIVKSLRS